MKMFRFLTKKKTTDKVFKSALKRARHLTDAEFTIFSNIHNLPINAIDTCIRHRADAQMLVVAHDAAMIELCFLEEAVNLGILSEIEVMVDNYDLEECGLSKNHMRNGLCELWARYSPLTRANLDYRYRFLLQQHLLEEKEIQLFWLFEKTVSSKLTQHFSFGEPLDVEWIEFLANLAASETEKAHARLNYWCESIKSQTDFLINLAR